MRISFLPLHQRGDVWTILQIEVLLQVFARLMVLMQQSDVCGVLVNPLQAEGGWQPAV